MGKGGPKLVLSTTTSLRNEISDQQVDYLNFKCFIEVKKNH